MVLFYTFYRKKAPGEPLTAYPTPGAGTHKGPGRARDTRDTRTHRFTQMNSSTVPVQYTAVGCTGSKTPEGGREQGPRRFKKTAGGEPGHRGHSDTHTHTGRTRSSRTRDPATKVSRSRQLGHARPGADPRRLRRGRPQRTQPCPLPLPEHFPASALEVGAPPSAIGIALGEMN